MIDISVHKSVTFTIDFYRQLPQPEGQGPPALKILTRPYFVDLYRLVHALEGLNR